MRSADPGLFRQGRDFLFDTSSLAAADRLWQEYFRDPCQWWDNRKFKVDSKAPDFRHKTTKESLWVDGWDNPLWVREILTTKDPVISWELLHLPDAVSLLGLLDKPPSVDSFICTLQKCRKKKHLAYAKCVCAHICNNGLQTDTTVGNYIVPMFVECGTVSSAQQIFDRLAYRNEHSWTSLILGYVENGQSHSALSLYRDMQGDNIHPSSYTLTAILRACTKLKDVQRGRQIHTEITRCGFERDVSVGSALIGMYAKSWSITEAREVFDKLTVRNVITWNALITGYLENGYSMEAVKCFDKMQAEGVPPSAVTFVCTLKACSILRDVDKGQKIHSLAAQWGFDKDSFVSNGLVDMYAKCGLFAEAQKVFSDVQRRDVVSWTALISGYVQNEYSEKALECFDEMLMEGVPPDIVTFSCILKACGKIKAIDKGREIHTKITERGLERIMSGSALVDMYIKCGCLSEAREAFDKLLIRDVVAWTTLIAGYVENGFNQEALKCFDQMQLERVPPNDVTFVCSLKACGNIGALDKGCQIHMQAAQRGFERDLFVGSSLVGMYAKCGSLVQAQDLFDNLPARDTVSWTALILGYAENGYNQKALKGIELMQLEGIVPDITTFLCSLRACGNIGAVDKGRKIHVELVKNGYQGDIFVGSALVDMYAKCGSLVEARHVFEMLPVRTVVSWNAMIRGYGTNNEASLAIACFHDMQEQGVMPDDATFLSLLATCSRTNLVVKGQQLFKIMKGSYGITPRVDHYNCIIDILCRSGKVYEAEKLLQIGLCPPSRETWTTLLNACRTYGEVGAAQRCFENLVRLSSENAVPYVLLANIYANAGRLDDASKVEELRKRAGAKKKLASASIEVKDEIHEFVVGNKPSDEVLAVLENLSLRIREEGHVPNVDSVLKPISDEDKELSLCGHAERLAIAFGLLHTPQGQTLHVSKNLRMCNDCHDTSKIISRIESREIFLKESNWVHHFKDGLCSCEDMW